MSISTISNYQRRVLEIAIIFLTIIITRIGLWINWDTALMQIAKADTWHHAYTGLVIIAISLTFSKYKLIKTIFLAIGLGLLFDEITLPLCWIGYPVDYWSPISLVATLFSLFIYLWFRLRHL